MSTANPTACRVPLTVEPGTGFNNVAVPASQGAEYTAITNQILYEIWQTNLLILAATPPAMATVMSFVAGDGQAGSPAIGTNTLQVPALQGQSIINKQLLVIREGIALMWDQPDGTLGQIRRYNTGGNAGWTFEGALVFNAGERYDVYITSINSTDES